MSSVIPFGISKVLQYLTYTVKTCTEYDYEDLAWIGQMVINMYETLSKDSYKLYLLLSILNQKSFTGYFARQFNHNLMKAVKKRDETSFYNLAISPKVAEFNIKTLTEEEKTELNNLTSLDVMSTNLTILRLMVNDNNSNDIEKIFEESRDDLYNKLYIGSFTDSKADFQTFAIVTEYNPISRTNHAFTFDLYSLLNGQISKDLNPETLANARETYTLEYKIINHKYS